MISNTTVGQLQINKNHLIFSILKTHQNWIFLTPLGHLNAVLKVATEESIPNYESKTKLKQMKFWPWAEKMYTAAKRSKLKWWASEGFTRDVHH